MSWQSARRSIPLLIFLKRRRHCWSRYPPVTHASANLQIKRQLLIIYVTRESSITFNQSELKNVNEHQRMWKEVRINNLVLKNGKGLRKRTQTSQIWVRLTVLDAHKFGFQLAVNTSTLPFRFRSSPIWQHDKFQISLSNQFDNRKQRRYSLWRDGRFPHWLFQKEKKKEEIIK